MPQIPLFNPSGRQVGGQISPSTAQIAEKARGDMLKTVQQTTEHFVEKKLAADRAVDVATRVSNAIQTMEAWDLQQTAYDENGNLRSESYVNEANQQWAEINKSLGSSRDPVVNDTVSARLQEYYSRKSIKLNEKAYEWDISHKRASFNDNLRTISRLAATNPAMLVDGMTMIELNKGLLYTAEESEKIMDAFKQQAVVDRVQALTYARPDQALSLLRRMRIESGNSGKPLPIDSDKHIALLRSAIAEKKRQDDELEDEIKQSEERTVLDFLVDVSEGKRSSADFTQLGITDVNLLIKAQSSAGMFSKGQDNPEAVRSFYLAYAKGEADIGSLLSLKEQTSVPTFIAAANLMKETVGKQKMFNDATYKEVRGYLEDRLRLSGRFAKRSDFERVVLPQVLREFTLASAKNWTGTADIGQLYGIADELIIRAEQSSLTALSNSTIRNAIKPKYASENELRAAYEAGALGTPGSRVAMTSLSVYLDQIELWDKRSKLKETERKNTLNLEGAKGLGDFK